MRIAPRRLVLQIELRLLVLLLAGRRSYKFSLRLLSEPQILTRQIRAVERAFRRAKGLARDEEDIYET